MHISLTAVLLAGVSYASAQTVHQVLVGNGGLTFTPSNITAALGDKVAFEFRAKNHTVTQSTFAQPCVPGSFQGQAGADSGFLAIPANNTIQPGQFPIWTITVNSTAPLWFHCAQTIPKNHCQSGMVFSINETPDKSFAAYLANAQAFDPATAATASTGGTVSSDPAAAGSVATGTPAAGTTPPDVASGGALGSGSTSESSNANAPPTIGSSGAVSVGVSRGAAGLLAAVTLGALLL